MIVLIDTSKIVFNIAIKQNVFVLLLQSLIEYKGDMRTSTQSKHRFINIKSSTVMRGTGTDFLIFDTDHSKKRRTLLHM